MPFVCDLKPPPAIFLNGGDMDKRLPLAPILERVSDQVLKKAARNAGYVREPWEEDRW
jgi:hypothetical protein